MVEVAAKGAVGVEGEVMLGREKACEQWLRYGRLSYCGARRDPCE